VGSFPQYNVITGQFDGMPNAIVPVEAKDIKVPEGIKLKTDPVPGLPGMSCCCEKRASVGTERSKCRGE
jgi:hypothetical protein